MPLPQIQFANGGLDKWHWDHWNDHLEILSAVQSKLNVSLNQWPIFPFTPESADTWLRLHQAMHFDMNNAIGLPGQDLTGADFNNPAALDAFYDMNYIEHSNAREALGI